MSEDMLVKSKPRPMCPARCRVIKGRRRTVTEVSCKWPDGHDADGAGVFAYHTADLGKQLIIWNNYRDTVDLTEEDE